MNRFVYFLVFIFFIKNNVFGQVVGAEILQNQEIISSPNVTTNSIQTFQQGNSNSVFSNQIYQNQGPNTATITQIGNISSSYLNQNGSNLSTSISQYQNQNQAESWSLGSNINTNIIQFGNRNELKTYVENYSNSLKNAEFFQNGNFNYIELSVLNSLESSSGQQISIVQNGNNQSITANMGNYSSPITITQNPGFNGEGMTVNISTSTFGFPGRR